MCLSGSDGSGLTEAVGNVWVLELQVKRMVLGTLGRLRLRCQGQREAQGLSIREREYREEDTAQHREGVKVVVNCQYRLEDS